MESDSGRESLLCPIVINLGLVGDDCLSVGDDIYLAGLQLGQVQTFALLQIPDQIMFEYGYLLLSYLSFVVLRSYVLQLPEDNQAGLFPFPNLPPSGWPVSWLSIGGQSRGHA
jgi:hypothetical protein